MYATDRRIDGRMNDTVQEKHTVPAGGRSCAGMYVYPLVKEVELPEKRIKLNINYMCYE